MSDAVVNDGEILVFVYGTLKRGHGNRHWLAGAPFLGEVALPDVVLQDLGPFPMAVAGEGLVRGEVCTPWMQPAPAHGRGHPAGGCTPAVRRVHEALRRLQGCELLIERPRPGHLPSPFRC